jgi:cell shape-determining protein MreC
VEKLRAENVKLKAENDDLEVKVAQLDYYTEENSRLQQLVDMLSEEAKKHIAAGVANGKGSQAGGPTLAQLAAGSLDQVRRYAPQVLLS